MPWNLRDPDSWPHGVYRIYDAEDTVIYIGVSIDPDSRLKNGHAHTAQWIGEYHHHDVTWYDTRDQAEAAETSAIEGEHPVYNVAHNQPSQAQPKTRITLDLDQEAYTALNQWLGSAAAEVGAPVSKARALRAMIRAVSLDKSIGLVVIDLLRQDG